MSAWSDDRVETLKRLWREGASVSRIAGRLGGGLTRDAVLGKVYRLGLSGTGRPGEPDRSPRSEASPPRTPARHWPPAAPGAPLRLDAAASGVSHSAGPACPGGVGLLDLGVSSCRFPLAGRDWLTWLFCGAARVPGASYCAAHLAAAHAPPDDSTVTEAGEGAAPCPMP